MLRHVRIQNEKLMHVNVWSVEVRAEVVASSSGFFFFSRMLSLLWKTGGRNGASEKGNRRFREEKWQL